MQGHGMNWQYYDRDTANNSYILQTEQHELKGRMLFHLGNASNLLQVICWMLPLATQCHTSS